MCANSPSSSSSVGARTHDYKVKVRVGLNRNDTVFENHSFAFYPFQNIASEASIQTSEIVRKL